MIEMNFFQVLGLTAMVFLVVIYVVCAGYLYDIHKSCITVIKFFKHYRFYKKIKPGNIYEYEGKVNPDNSFDDLYYLSRIKILDIKDGYIKYVIDYIVSDENGKFNLENPRSSFINVDKWWYMIELRELTKYKKNNSN